MSHNSLEVEFGLGQAEVAEVRVRWPGQDPGQEETFQGITANSERTRDMVLSSLGIVTVLKPSLGYKQCAEIAREGYETGKSLHEIVVKERKLLTQEKWDEVFSFENLISPKFEQ